MPSASMTPTPAAKPDPSPAPHGASAAPTPNETSTRGATDAKPSHVLEDLVSQDRRQLLDIIDKLRDFELGQEFALPQLVVCGDQSSGKSSVLEALTEINFPREASVACTRFATVISLRRAEREKMTVQIIPHFSHSPQMQAKLRDFREQTENFEQLASELGVLIQRAKSAMGIDSAGAGTASRRFTLDVLKIEVSGPNRPQLTVVDLPGLFRNDHGANVTSNEAGLVEKLTKDFICQPRTICLPVITASTDIANQGIFKMIRESADPQGHRTMGIITRPDRLEEGADVSKFVRLAQNEIEDYRLERGWHVLRNRSPYQMTSFAERNETEIRFFLTSAFRVIEPGSRGISSLRKRLGDMLFQLTQQELPKVRQDIQTRLESEQATLANLGPERIHPNACREYLTKVAQDTQKLCDHASFGYYQGAFYPRVAVAAFNARQPVALRRLRAVLRDSYAGFIKDMAANGHTWAMESTHSLIRFPPPPQLDGDMPTEVPSTFPLESYEEIRLAENFRSGLFALDKSGSVKKSTTSPPTSGLFGSTNSYSFGSQSNAEPWLFNSAGSKPVAIRPKAEFVISYPISISILEMVKKISDEMAVSSGQEMQGQSNPIVVRTLFMEQCQRWFAMASNHIDNVAKICVSFMEEVLRETCAPDVRARIWAQYLDEAMKTRKMAALAMFAVLERSLREHPFNDSRMFEDHLKTVRQKREDEEEERLAQYEAKVTAFETQSRAQSGSKKGGLFEQAPAVAQSSEPPIKPSAAVQDTLDRMVALYEVKQTVFVDNVNSLVVEDNLVRGLAEVLSPIWTSRLADSELQSLAKESDQISRERQRHSKSLSKLREGDKILRSLL